MVGESGRAGNGVALGCGGGGGKGAEVVVNLPGTPEAPNFLGRPLTRRILLLFGLPTWNSLE